jgi:diguanylate cyclase (GGDEF)-like protein/PAS domain S-box-containing protein
LDDDPQILKVLSEFLQTEGFTITTSCSPEEILSELEGTKSTLLITDIYLPDWSGIDVARRAKEIDPDLAIVVMTGISEVAIAVQAMRVGADDYVLKPFDFSEISIAVHNAIEKRTLKLNAQAYEADLKSKVDEATGELKDKNSTLVETQTYLNNLIDSTVDAIVTIDLEDKIIFANRGAQRMLGFSENQLKNMRFSYLLKGGEEEFQYIRRVLRPDQPLQNYEAKLKHHNDNTIPVNISFSLVPDAQGEVVSIVAICKDITDQKRLEEELKELTIRDGMTGLYNVRFFYERLESEIERAIRQDHTISLLLIDIDKFKGYNDSHGHLEGDKVLKEVANVIMECTRDHVDLGFRYGGDEFMVILSEADESTSLKIAQRIRETFEAKHFDLLTLSIGLMMYQKEYSSRTFIQFTDSMMYDAKRSGGNRVYVYGKDGKQPEALQS